MGVRVSDEPKRWNGLSKISIFLHPIPLSLSTKKMLHFSSAPNVKSARCHTALLQSSQVICLGKGHGDRLIQATNRTGACGHSTESRETRVAWRLTTSCYADAEGLSQLLESTQVAPAVIPNASSVDAKRGLPTPHSKHLISVAHAQAARDSAVFIDQLCEYH